MATAAAAAAEACFRECTCRVRVHVAAPFTADVAAGVRQALQGWLLQYRDDVGGIPVAFSQVTFLQPHARMRHDRPGVVARVSARLLLFVPAVGTRLVGTVSKIGPDHIGLLVWGTFNASLPRDGIDSDFQCDEACGCWYDTSEAGRPSIELGSKLVFEVTGIETVNEVLAIRGTMVADEDAVNAGRAPSQRDGAATLDASIPKVVSSRDAVASKGNDDEEAEHGGQEPAKKRKHRRKHDYAAPAGENEAKARESGKKHKKSHP